MPRGRSSCPWKQRAGVLATQCAATRCAMGIGAGRPGAKRRRPRQSYQRHQSHGLRRDAPELDGRAEPAEEAAGTGGSAAAAAIGSPGMSAMTDTDVVDRQPPPAGSPSDAGQPTPDEGEPSSTEPRTADRWHCFEGDDSDGFPHCNCTRNSKNTSDDCASPKPTCCFSVTIDDVEQCLCYQADSPTCEIFTSQSRVLGTIPVSTCPPQ